MRGAGALGNEVVKNLALGALEEDIGLEDVELLWGDLEQALARV